MAGVCSKAVIVLVAALALVAGASAASPNVAAMNLRAADVPGAKVISQGAVKEKGYLTAYVRNFVFSPPNVSSGLVTIDVETRLASSSSVAAADVSLAGNVLRSSTRRKGFIATVAKEAGVKPSSVAVGALRKVAGYDHGLELPVTITVQGRRLYKNHIYLQLDRVFVFMVEFGSRPIKATVTAKYATAIAGRIETQLAPALVSAPAVTGTVQKGRTLSAAPGTWRAANVTFTYQWQRCDGMGANCTDVARATRRSYAVTRPDVGWTLRVVVTAANRFGSPTARSVATRVVL